MKKVFINIAIIITFIFIYLLQANFFTWFKIAGVMPNLFIILMLYIGLFMGRTSAISYGLILGILIDIFVSRKLGITSIMLAVVGIIADLFDKNFSKDNRITLMFMVLSATIIYEVILYILQILICNMEIEIISFLKIIIIETIYNLIITIIIYSGFQRFGNYVQETFTEDKSFIKYF